MTCPYEGGHDLLFRELNYPAEMQAGSNITSFVLTVYRLYFKPGEQSFRLNNDESYEDMKKWTLEAQFRIGIQVHPQLWME